MTIWVDTLETAYVYVCVCQIPYAVSCMKVLCRNFTHKYIYIQTNLQANQAKNDNSMQLPSFLPSSCMHADGWLNCFAKLSHLPSASPTVRYESTLAYFCFLPYVHVRVHTARYREMRLSLGWEWGWEWE